MLYRLKGILIHQEPGVAVVECGGVGFKCMVTMNTMRALPAIGVQAVLYTHMNVREDALDLFGFATQEEMGCFKTLTGVSGVGPKVGLSILSELAPEQIAIAISAGDYKALTRASGVGPKLAQRIVLELRDKVASMSADAQPGSFAVGAVGIASAAGHASEAVGALTVLGYTPSDAAAAVARLDSDLPVEELIRLALKSMAPKK